MNKSNRIVFFYLVSCCTFQSAAFAIYNGDTLSDLLAPNNLPKNGAKQLLVRYESRSESVDTNKIVLEGISDGKVLWSKPFSRYPNDYGELVQSISAGAEGNSIIAVTKFVRGPNETMRFRWDGQKITFLAEHTDESFQNYFKKIFKKARDGSRQDYDKDQTDATQEVEYWWQYFDRNDLASLIKDVNQKALVSYQKHDLTAATDRLYCGLDCAAMYGSKLASYNGSTKVVDMDQAKPLVWLDSFAQMDYEVPGIPPSAQSFRFKPSNYIDAVNNYAYYLQLQGKHAQAIPVFQKILTLEPERTVAYLNLADSLWSVGEKSKGTKAYGEYLSHAQKAHVKTIPERAKQRSGANLQH